MIPHAFGRQRPPVISNDDMLREKVERKSLSVIDGKAGGTMVVMIGASKIGAS